MTEAVQASHLSAALVRAQVAAQAVAKSSSNDYHQYAYAAAEDVIAEARSALNGAGLALFAAQHQIEEGTLHVEYVLVHESGESRTITSSTPIIPRSGRPADKALAVAKTYDLSYTLRSLLLLPRSDGTPDERDDRKFKSKSDDKGRTNEERKAEREFQKRWRHYLKLRQMAGWPKNPQGEQDGKRDPKPTRGNIEEHIAHLESVIADREAAEAEGIEDTSDLQAGWEKWLEGANHARQAMELPRLPTADSPDGWRQLREQHERELEGWLKTINEARRPLPPLEAATTAAGWVALAKQNSADMDARSR